MKKKTVKGLALLMAAAMTASAVPGIGSGVTAQAADQWIGDGDLEEKNTDKPEPDEVLPSENQYNYQKEELAAFCHFGPNTFNEIEWGENYGNRAPSEIFTLSQDFDAETLVKAVKDAGFHKLIVTAKHHDGFCIWDSEYTEYDVAATNYPGDSETGRKDILEEISAACTEYDIDMGLYLSPWDIHDKSYGYYDENGDSLIGSNGQPLNNLTWEEVEEKDVYDYNEYYNNQLQEILGNSKYGNKGHFVEVWMDGAKGSGAKTQNYDFEKWFDTIQKNEGIKGGYKSDCMLFGAEAYTTVRWIGNENGIAGTNTWSKSTVDKEANTINSNQITENGTKVTVGFEDGNQWTVPEADARITSGWFWGTTKAAPKSLDNLAKMYFNSVGHNSPLLLNIPPNNQGTVDEAILNRLEEFGNNIKETFKTNMAAAKGAEVKASNVRGGDTAFKPGNTVDGKDDTYWTTDNGTNQGSLLINLGSAKKFDVVSIEEAIQNGQRINSYKVEYRNGSGDWTLLEEGETIGAKRLIRVPAVTADQVKITVGTTEGKVPMISEIGVYKASEGFELASSAPAGMDIIDVTDKDPADGAGFTFTGKWTDQTGSEYVNETNTWANAGASFTLKFTGTKVYLVGTTDPNHGTATIQIDNGDPVTVDTNAGERSTGQIWFSSEDLTDGEHTLTLNVTDKAIGIEAAYVINNGGVGMIGLESDAFTMNEDETMDVKITRVGGTKGRIKAYLSPNPGSAIQDDFFTEPVVVTLANGESETTVPVTTRRNENKTGTQDFSIQLNSASSGLILGFIDTATVNILDAESMTEEKLRTLYDSAKDWEESLYTGDWDTFAAARAAAADLLKEENPDALEMSHAYSALESAMDGLTKRTAFTAEDPVVLPTKQDETVTAEAEFLALDSSGAAEGKHVRITDGASDSNGQHLGWFENGNRVTMHYYAPIAGTYKVTVTYASGRGESNKNNITFVNDDGTNVKNEYYQSAAGDEGTVWQTAAFDLTVNTAGAGTLVMTTDNGAPNLDKFEITPAEGTYTYDITAKAGKGGTIDPAGVTSVAKNGSQTYTITPDDGYAISKVLVDDEEVSADIAENGVGTYTVENVAADTAVEAQFEFANYTETTRFEFPTEADKAETLEAEFSTLNNSGQGEAYPLQVTKEETGDDGWPSNGSYINGLNTGDTFSIPYFAEKTGTYQVTLTYKSGDTKNAISWSEANGKITEDSISGVPDAEAWPTDPVKHTTEFEFEVTTPGAGLLTIAAGQHNGPMIDKFDIALTEATGTLADELYKVDLEIAMQEAQKELGMPGGTYTEDSLKTLQNALNEAQAVFDNVDATQAQVDEKLEALQTALDGLTPPTYAVNVSVDGDVGGTIKASAETVERGGSADLTITPDYGYTATLLTINGTALDAPQGGSVIGADEFYGPSGTYTISNITANQTAVVKFEKTGYTDTDDGRFVFPEGNEVKKLEAEAFTLFNKVENGEKYRLGVTTDAESWTQGETFINGFNSGDRISVPYSAKAGTYEVTVRYSSGSNNNKLVWDSNDGTITAGEAAAGNSDANALITTTFDVTVTGDGNGIWTFTAPSANSPRVDYFEIRVKGQDPEPTEKFEVTARVEGTNGTVSVDPAEVTSGGEATVTFSPNEGCKVGRVTVNDEEVTVTGSSYTITNITEDIEVVVTYMLDYYTAAVPFYFPAAVGNTETVQAEHFILNDNNDGKGEIRETEDGEAEGGRFVNWFNTGDNIQLNYYAEKAGEYKFTMRYRSGSASNAISWSGEKITSGSLDGVEADPSDNLQWRTAEFTVEVTEPGAGTLTIAAGASNAPQIDQFIIELVEETGAATVDKTALAAKIEEAAAEAAKTDVYTEESITALKAAIETAQAVYDNPEAAQADVNEQVNALEAAINALEVIPEPETYTINASAGEGGSIDPSGEVTVNEGASQTFTITAEDGWEISDVKVNGESVGAVDTYTFENVSADAVIEASFEQEQPPVPADPDKTDLKAALDEANAILSQTDKYTEASLADYKAVADKAQAVYNSDKATEEEIAQAIADLKEAQKLLVEIPNGEPGDGDKPSAGDPSADKPSGSTKPDNAVQTGDESSPILWIVVLAAACAAGGAVIRLRLRRSGK